MEQSGDGSSRPGGENGDVRTTRGSRAAAELSEMWETRPARPRDDRKIAGVAAAIGRRYDIDPVLVRIAFVVAAFYGPGIPLYLAACVVLPDAGSPHRPARGRGPALTATVLVAVAAVVSAIVLLGGDGRWFLPLLVSLGLLVALHVTRGHRGTAGGVSPAAPHGPAPGDTPGTASVAGAPVSHPASGETTTAGTGDTGTGDAGAGDAGAGDAGADARSRGAGAVAADAAAGEVTVPVAPAGHPTDRTPSTSPPAAGPVPPAWDPLGAAPFAWDLPDPSPEPGPPAQPPSRLTPVTLAVALVAAGITGVLALTAPGSLGAAAVPATALAVVGIGLVIGAFRHAGRWLIPFAGLLAAATWLVGAVPWPDLRDGVGDITAAPATTAGLAPEYRRGIGSISLDLTRLDLAAAPGTPVTPVRTSARVGVGSVTVVVPRGADLVVRGDAGLGDVALAGQDRSGASARLDVTDPGPDGPGGRPIELDLHAGVGSLEVTRD